MNLPPEVNHELATLTNLIHALAIIQEGYVLELEQKLRRYGQFQYAQKKNIKTMKKQAIEMRAIINKADPVHADEYGEEADKIELLIKELINKLLKDDTQGND